MYIVLFPRPLLVLPRNFPLVRYPVPFFLPRRMILVLFFFQCSYLLFYLIETILFLIAPLRATFRTLIYLLEYLFAQGTHSFPRLRTSRPVRNASPSRAVFVYLGRCASRPPPFILSASLFVYSFAPFTLVPRLLFPSSFRF